MNYKHGKTNQITRCIDCKKRISDYRHKRCYSCEIKRRIRDGKINMQGKKNPRYREVGSKLVTNRGRIFIKIADPNIWIFEHRYIVQKSIGRPLKSFEIVHHINGICNDNRIENLCIVDSHNHEKHTFEKILQKQIRKLEAML